MLIVRQPVAKNLRTICPVLFQQSSVFLLFPMNFTQTEILRGIETKCKGFETIRASANWKSGMNNEDFISESQCFCACDIVTTIDISCLWKLGLSMFGLRPLLTETLTLVGRGHRKELTVDAAWKGRHGFRDKSEDFGIFVYMKSHIQQYFRFGQIRIEKIRWIMRVLLANFGTFRKTKTYQCSC
jgi:hypothetical protein